MTTSRRELSLLLPAALAALAEAKEPVLTSRCYAYDALPEKANPKNGNETREVFEGATHKGVEIDLHITKLAPGQMPHPEHRHAHEEFVLLHSGTLEVTISGKTTTLGPGSVAVVASGELHGWKNTGQIPCEYFVLAVDKANT
jgi:quercetin dioxygenase-like cupin family protein